MGNLPKKDIPHEGWVAYRVKCEEALSMPYPQNESLELKVENLALGRELPKTRNAATFLLSIRPKIDLKIRICKFERNFSLRILRRGIYEPDTSRQIFGKALKLLGSIEKTLSNLSPIWLDLELTKVDPRSKY